MQRLLSIPYGEAKVVAEKEEEEDAIDVFQRKGGSHVLSVDNVNLTPTMVPVIAAWMAASAKSLVR